MKPKTSSQRYKHNSQPFTNKEDLNKNPKKDQKYQKQKPNIQLLEDSEDKNSSNLNNTSQQQDFMRISLLNQENSIFNSRVYQNYIKIYLNFTTLYSAPWNYGENRNQLVIYDIKRKREKVQLIDLVSECIASYGCITRLPNENYFFFASKNEYDITDAFLIDKDFHVHKLPYWSFVNGLSAIYYNRSVYCFGGHEWTIRSNITFSVRFDLDEKLWIKLSPLPMPAAKCTNVIFNGNILISSPQNINLWLYSIDIDSFSIVPYEFKLLPKIMINAEERLYLIEYNEHWFLYESNIWDEFSWMLIASYENIGNSHGEAHIGIYNKELEGIYILSLEKEKCLIRKRHYWIFDLNRKVLYRINRNNLI